MMNCLLRIHLHGQELQHWEHTVFLQLQVIMAGQLKKLNCISNTIKIIAVRNIF